MGETFFSSTREHLLGMVISSLATTTNLATEQVTLSWKYLSTALRIYG